MKENPFSRFFKRFGQKTRPESGFGGPGSSDAEAAKMMVRGIVSTRSDEIGCDECFDQVDRYAEMILDGRDAASALPLVRDHLNRCNDCREEFEALVTALRSLA